MPTVPRLRAPKPKKTDTVTPIAPTAHAAFTPPAKIDELEARPQARQEFLLVPPYVALAALAVLLLAVAVIRESAVTA